MNDLIHISASLMCCNPLILGEEINRLEKAQCDGFHIDIMDGHFVKNFAMNIRDLKFIRKATDLPIDVHLMIDEPSRYIQALASTGIDRICIHPESCRNYLAVIESIREFGIRAGIVLSPHIGIEILNRNLLSMIDTVLVMAVTPGFAGQSFIPETIDRVSKIYTFLEINHFENMIIEVDGAVSTRTIPVLYDSGARKFVAGSSGLFMEDVNYFRAIKDLKGSIESLKAG